MVKVTSRTEQLNRYISGIMYHQGSEITPAVLQQK